MKRLRPLGLGLLALVALLPATVRLAPAPAPAPAPVRPVPPRPARLELVAALKLEPSGKDAHGDVATYKNLA
ncbi:MAG TPA: hypothetical protein VKK19_07260, partial [Candidatus Dormibacteraeota bacterium]|nr:hypothetical protein [Candidatus Dormibacteraeota bacterium]